MRSDFSGQQQKQAAAFAAAQAAAVAAQQKSRCDECNINFAKHQNYVAHKKYYCSANSGSSAAGGSNLQAAKSTLPAPPLPITSDNDDDKSSDDGKSQRKLSPPIRSPALLIAGLTSPKDRKEGNQLKFNYLITVHIKRSHSINIMSIQIDIKTSQLFIQ